MRWQVLQDRHEAAASLSASVVIALICIFFCAVVSTGQQSTLPAGQMVRPTGGTSLPAEAASPFLISGIVVDSMTKQPISNAVLTIEPMTTVRKAVLGTSRRPRRRPRPQAVSAAATADAAGHFELEAPSAGGWALTASARGYRSQALDEHEGYSTAILLTESAPRADVTFRLTPQSTIEGYILDEAGEAVRSAQVVLSYIPPATPENAHPRPQIRAQQATDDRGFYKFSANGPGSYQVRAAARPWYATSAPQRLSLSDGDAAQDTVPTGSDPLDVVYPTTWYPGVIDPSAAGTIVLHGGETQEANLRLLPVPGFHLRVQQPAVQQADQLVNEAQERRGARNPPVMTYVTRLMPDGTEDAAASSSTITDGQGNTDIAGLVPGNYLVHQQSSSNQSASLSTLHIGPNSAQTVDFGDATQSTVVTVQIDPSADSDSIQISFQDMETGHVSYVERAQDAGSRTLRRRGQADSSSTEKAVPHSDGTIALPSGKYEVALNAQGDLRLTGIQAVGATATGRIVTIDGGAPRLVLHVATGRCVVSGTVSFHGHPAPGAMVLLIPASLGDPAGIDLPARDQSNSDGSFEMSSVLPGAYILVAIDHGWDLNWSDPSTLRRYLIHGTPLDIKPSADLKEHIEAVAP